MHIVMFSMTPLFEHKSMGGAQKQLKKIAIHLAELGHQVTILCTRRDDAVRFQWHDNLTVIPIFRFKQPFPEPYATDVYNIAHAVQTLNDYLQDADVFYNHDGGIIFPYIYERIPTVISLRSILFAETLQSGFLFQADKLIVPSEHTAHAWQYTVGRFFPEFASRVKVIHNGLDFDVYQPTDATALIERLGLTPDEHDYILYPHRPDDAKGIRQAIKLMDKLVNERGMTRVRLLVPQWIDTGLSKSVKAYYDELEADIDARGLREHFIFHDWISDDEMPQYFNLGAVTIALGHYVETFGNTPYESLACGTPVVVANVGPYRDMLPNEFVSKVNYDDMDMATEHVARIINDKQRSSDDARLWLKIHFNQEDMVKRYADLILNATVAKRMDYIPQAVTTYQLAPWCCLTERGIYHDFKATYLWDDSFVNWVQGNGTLTGEQLQWGYDEGYLVPNTANKSHIVYVGIGSNTQHQANIQRGLALLGQVANIHSVSRIYETPSIGHEGEPYWNLAVKISTVDEVEELKRLLEHIEDELGRVRRLDDGSKNLIVPIDFDILLFDDDVMNYGEGKQIPHEDIIQYSHVAVPLSEIASHVIHPKNNKTIAEIARQFKLDGIKILPKIISD